MKNRCILHGCVFVMLHFEAGFLVKRQKCLYLMHNYMSSRFSHDVPKKVQICCIITCKSMFSHDAPKTHLMFNYVEKVFFMTGPKTKCTFDALLRFIAGFLMTRHKGANLLHYYVSKQVFS